MLDSALHPVRHHFWGPWFCHQRGASDRSVSVFTGGVDTKVERLTVQVAGRDLPLDRQGQVSLGVAAQSSLPTSPEPISPFGPLFRGPKLRRSALPLPPPPSLPKRMKVCRASF